MPFIQILTGKFCSGAARSAQGGFRAVRRPVASTERGRYRKIFGLPFGEPHWLSPIVILGVLSKLRIARAIRWRGPLICYLVERFSFKGE